MLPNAKAFQLSSGQDCLHIALARGHFEMAKDILAYNPENQNKLIGNVDDDGHSHMMILGYFNLNKDIAHLMSQPYALLNEFQIFINGRGILQILCYMKRLQNIKFILQMLDKYQNLVESFYTQLTGIHKGMTVFEFLEADIDYQKCSSNREDVAEIKRILMALLPQGIKFLKNDMRRFGTHLSDFFKAAKFEIPMFTEEVKFSDLAKDCVIKLKDIDLAANPEAPSEVSAAEEIPNASPSPKKFQLQKTIKEAAKMPEDEETESTAEDNEPKQDENANEQKPTEEKQPEKEQAEPVKEEHTDATDSEEKKQDDAE